MILLDILGAAFILWVLWVIRESFKEGARRRRIMEWAEDWEHWK